MTENVINTKSLPETLLRMIRTEKVKISEANGTIQLTPISGADDCTIGLRGMFAAYPDMSVDKFLERKRAEKELDL